MVIVICLETAQKTNKRYHVFSLQRVVPCMADATVHMQEHSSVYSALLAPKALHPTFPLMQLSRFFHRTPTFC